MSSSDRHIAEKQSRLKVGEKAGKQRMCTSHCSFVKEDLTKQNLERSRGASPVGMWKENLLG